MKWRFRALGYMLQRDPSLTMFAQDGRRPALESREWLRKIPTLSYHPIHAKSACLGDPGYRKGWATRGISVRTI
jgi:hypothetical protein